MAMAIPYIPYMVAAAGAYAGAANTAHTNRKKDTQLAAGIQDQAEKQREAAGEVNALVNSRANSNSAEAKTNADQQLMDTLRRNAAGKGAVSTVDGASQRYRSQVEQGNSSVGDFGSELAGQISAVDSATRQREAEATDQQSAVTAIQQIQRRAAGDANINALKVNSLTNNPYVDLGASMAKNIGMAGAMQGGFGGAGKAFGGKVPVGSGTNFVPGNYATDPFNAGGALRAYA